MFGLIFQDEPEQIVQLEESAKIPTFPALDIYSEIVAKLSAEEPMEKIGQIQKDYHKRIPLRPTIDESVIIGRVVYIDSFDNAITNISQDLFYRAGENRKFQIFVQSNTNKIHKISTTYNENPEGELLALFNSLDLLEIAMNGGNVAQILSLDTDSTVRVRFY
jgi:S-adenosylmethionine hydrolase